MPDSYFACGLCDHRQDIPNPEDARKYENARYFMVEHYKYEHPERFGTKTSQPGIAFSDRWQFGPITDDFGPVLHYDGQTFHWSQA